MDDPKPYILVDGVEIGNIEQRVNEFIALGYIPQQMIVAQPMPGASSRPRYVVPMILYGAAQWNG